MPKINKYTFAQHIQQALADKTAITPRCKHFGTCGGCKLQSYSYADQLDAKRSAMQNLFAPLLSAEQLASYEIVGSPLDYEYRVKMEYVLGVSEFGLRKAGDFQTIVDLEECHLIERAEFALVRQVYQKSLELKISQLRYIAIKDVGEAAMLNLVTLYEFDGPEIELLANFALELGFKVVNWVRMPLGLDTAYGSVERSWPQSLLEFELRHKRYLLGANTFSQNNLAGFTQILDYVDSEFSAAHNMLDLYCGIGTLAIQYAHKADFVVGADEVADSIDLARQNLQLNNVVNTEFVTARVADFLHDPRFQEYSYWKQSDPSSRYRNDNKHFDTIIVDPARPGLEPKVCRRLQKYFAAEQLIYISCNPNTQFLDLQLLPDYRIKSIRAFDLFPQTLHVENVVILERK
jgi:23S rRNA (uracil1939-C5)-methyltransferase